MVIETNKGNFGGFEDVLMDMNYMKYDTIEVKNISIFAGIVRLDGAGVVTKAQIEQAIKETEITFSDLDKKFGIK